MTAPNVRDVVVRSADDLFTLWEQLMGPDGFGKRTLWVLYLDECGRPPGAITPIDPLPPLPDAAFVDAFGSIVSGLRADGEVDSVALLLSRPGSAEMTAGDRAWARAVAPLTPWPVHLATADQVRVFAPDDLMTR